MSMSAGNPKGQKAEINMTPMIDVLLVLIIIFMVITPIAPRGLEALVPQQAAGTPLESLPSRDIVISMAKDQSISINHMSVSREALPEKLAALYRNGSGNHLFVRGARELEYRDVVQVMDAARAAGWDRIGLMTQ